MCVLLYAGTGIPAGTKSPPGIGDGGGRLPVVVCGDWDGKNSPRGYGDGGLFLDGEFPVAILPELQFSEFHGIATSPQEYNEDA